MLSVLVGLLLVMVGDAQLTAFAKASAVGKLRATADTAVGRNFSSAAPAASVGRNFSSAAPQEKMSTFYVVLLKKGPVPLDAKSKAALEAHGAYVAKLGKEGTIAAAGPFATPGEVMGLAIMRVPAIERAKEVAAEDPAVKAGLFTPEILTWMALDVFRPWAEPFSQEADPMVKAGRLAVELYEWKAPKGALR